MSDNISSRIEQATGEYALKEYELAVQTQMHFNEILMKFRSFGIAVVIAVYSYAITRKDIGISFAWGLSPNQLLAMAGITLTFVLAIIDLRYFFPLLLGAVSRSTALEQQVPYRLTSSISARVSVTRSYFLITVFYGIIALWGLGLATLMLPYEKGQPQKIAIDGPVDVKIKSSDIDKQNNKR